MDEFYNMLFYYSRSNTQLVAKNDITGDTIKSKTAGHDNYRDNYDRIFGKKSAVDDASDVMSKYNKDKGSERS